jgi:hypothetical protein
MPLVSAIKPELRSKGLNGLQCWHVCYQFCGISAEITVYAKDALEARGKAVDELRMRGLKVA